jgi:uncharacterized protein (TIGR02001 family)
MKFSQHAALTSALFASLPIVQAAETDAETGPVDVSANVALTTDFVDRGLTYTDGDPAIQGGFDVDHETGAYVKTWAANVKLLEDDTVKPEDRATVLIGLYAGYEGDIISDKLSYELQAAHYLFPGASSDLNYDTTEFMANLTYSIQKTDLGLSYFFSPDMFGTGNSHYGVFSVTHTFVNELEISGQVGWQGFEDNKAMGLDDYLYHGLSLSYPIGDFTVAINYSNTDLDNADDVGGDDRVYFTLSY